ncbi:hypothetical protein [Streptomyces siamensis]|uniref:HNH endonuclease n=1 Tax=Streptomyces siamensis TaxID=1274986 RepID=A0ABP9IJ13_9ACTN
MICARCDQPILPGQPSTTYPVDSGSAAGADVTVHAELCDMPDHQTAPQLSRYQRWVEAHEASMARVSRYAPPVR